MKCPLCKGTGKEICDNPDHGVIDALSFHDIGRIGCPCCGHDENHAIPNTTCPLCEGKKTIECPICGSTDIMKWDEDGEFDVSCRGCGYVLYSSEEV